MHQTTHFFNLGYGWLCKHCCAENTERKQKASTPAFAKWTDEEHSGLMCPRCGIEEQLAKQHKHQQR